MTQTQPPRHRKPGIVTRALEALYDYGARRRGETTVTEHRPDPMLARAEAQLARNQAFVDSLPKFTDEEIARAVALFKQRIGGTR